MKTLTRILFLCIACLSWPQMQAEVMLLNENMTLDEALRTPYTITKSVDTDAHTITIDFRLNAIEFVDFDPMPGTKVCRIPGMEPQSLPELPQIPVIGLRYNIPSDQEPVITFTDDYYSKHDMVLAPGMPAIADVDYNGHIINPIKNYTGYYPEAAMSLTTVQNYRGLPIHHFVITPVSYNVENEEIHVYHTFTATITYTNGSSDTESDRSNIFKMARSRDIQDLVEEVDFTSDIELKEYPKERTQDYLIIANRYAYGVEEFAEWKRQLGFRVDLVTEIPGVGKNGVPDRTAWTWQEIRSLIKQKYLELDNLAYVMIWGRHDNVPGIPFTELNLTEEREVGYPDTDKLMSYSAYSLIDDDIKITNDITPKFSVGRIYATTKDHTLTAVQKIINYEKNPVTDPSFYKNAFLVGQFESVGTDNPKYFKKDSISLSTEDYGMIQWLERTRPILTENGIDAKRIYRRHQYMHEYNAYPKFWSTSKYSTTKVDSDYIQPLTKEISEDLLYSKFKWDGKISDVQQCLSEGSFLGLYFSHGNCNGWYAMDDMRASHFNAGSCGNKSPLIFSITCRSGQTDWNASFANELSHSENGPIGMFASTDISYISSNKTFLYGLTNALFPEPTKEYSSPFFRRYSPSYRLGDILRRGWDFCYAKAPKALYFIKHQICTYTCFGDPSIDINTAVPTSFSEPLISGFGPLVNVDLQAEYDYPVFINFYEKQTGRVESYEYDGWDYYFEASPEADSVNVSITSHNKIPYFTTVAVNDGESYNPRVHGRFTGHSFEPRAYEVVVEFELSHSVDGAVLRYAVLDDDLQSVERQDEIEIQRYQKRYSIPMPAKFRGYIQYHLIYQGYLLDSYKVRVNL